jgi:tRNA pseudouridine55 synthase
MVGGRVRMPLDGLLLLDKPLGWSSNQALKKAQFLLNANKAGHCGTLDPLATGLLPVVLGEATRFATDLLDADKTYVAHIRLGITTDTGDAEGKTLSSLPVDITLTRWEDVLAGFRGELEQTPPMYSALKHAGKPLYRWAREGVEIERASRRIRIFELTTLSFESPQVQVRVRCSKGTYIRTLAEDIGRALGCGAHLTGLRRERIAELDVARAISIEELSALDAPARLARVQPLDYLLRGLSVQLLDADQARRFLLGQRIRLSPAGTDANARTMRVYNQNESSAHLLGLAKLDDGLLSPIRVMNSSHKDPETV